MYFNVLIVHMHYNTLRKNVKLGAAFLCAVGIHTVRSPALLQKNEIALIFVMYMKLVSLAYLHISTLRFFCSEFNAALSKRICSLIYSEELLSVRDIYPAGLCSACLLKGIYLF